jgi:5-formyltetrahydrofolate cyclo-ligase
MDPGILTPASTDWSAIRTWRVQAREALIHERLSCGRSLRQQRSDEARRRLIESVDLAAYPTLGMYSPMRGEIDVLGLAAEHLNRGGRIGLPVVVDKSGPVEFWRWWPGMPMSKGIWNIPIPATRERVEPDALIVPLVGFDRALFRLGYGGGYYDRTLAQRTRRPFCVGLGFQTGLLPSIYPQAHDIPMDLIVTDEQVYSGQPPG